MARIASLSGTPGLGAVNSNPPFSFKSSSAVRGDYASRPSVAALQNPTLHNKVPESMVNSTARAPLFVRPFSRGFEKGYSEGDVLFVKRENISHASSTHNIVANIPVLNHILRTTKNADGNRLKYQNVDDFLEDWNYYGILNNDMDTGSKWQRLLNVNVRGRSRVARLWNPRNGRLRRGHCLWLALVERNSGPRIATFQDPNGMREPMESNTKYLELVATMDCCDEYENSILAIPVGIVSQVTLKTPTPVSLRAAHHVTEKCKLLERIEVLMRI